MKTIIVKWVSEDKWGYGKAMRVIKSSHKRFIKISLPMDIEEQEND